MSLSSGPHLPVGVASGSASSRGSSGVATCPTAPNGLRTTGIKKVLAILGMQLGSRVSKMRSCVTETSARHVDMRRHHNLQDVGTSRYSAAQQCSAARLPTHRHGWQGMWTQQEQRDGTSHTLLKISLATPSKKYPRYCNRVPTTLEPHVGPRVFL
jgi:hypothetical protein